MSGENASLPQQAATEEGAIYICCYCNKPLTRVTPDNGGACDRCEMGFTKKDLKTLALSTPTSHPLAAETRLREARDIAYRCLDAFETIRAPSLTGDDLRQAIAEEMATVIAAALTQPEPTAQQAEAMNGSEKADFAEFYDLPIEALSAQQAAGEAVAMQCPECGMGRPGHKWDCPRAPVLTLGPRTADDAALQPEAWRGIESAIAAKTREPIFLEMRDIYMGQAGYRTPGQIADAAWFTGQPNPGATIPAAPLTDGGKAE